MKRFLLAFVLFVIAVLAFSGCTKIKQKARSDLMDTQGRVVAVTETECSGYTLFDGKQAVAAMKASATGKTVSAGSTGVQQESTSALLTEMFAFGRDALAAYMKGNAAPAPAAAAVASPAPIPPRSTNAPPAPK